MQKLKAVAERLTPRGPERLATPKQLTRDNCVRRAWSKLAFRARGVLIGSAASIPITHFTPFNQHRLFLFHQIGPCLVYVNDLFHDLGELSVGGGVLEDLRRPAKNFAAAAHWRRRSGGSIRFPGASPLM